MSPSIILRVKKRKEKLAERGRKRNQMDVVILDEGEQYPMAKLKLRKV